MLDLSKNEDKILSSVQIAFITVTHLVKIDNSKINIIHFILR